MLAGWFAPAAACLILAGVIFNPRSVATLSDASAAGGMVGMIMSNQSYAAYLPGSFQRTHNQLETFSSAASGGFLSPTNLIH